MVRASGSSLGIGLAMAAVVLALLAGLPVHSPSGPTSRAPVRGAGAVAVTPAGSRSSATTYSWTFSVSGLPCCWTWSVTIAGLTLGTGYGGSVTFPLSNGTYTWTASGEIYYVAAPANGTITVAGAGGSTTVNYYPPPRFFANFVETGLPTATAWGVKVHFNDVVGSWLYYNTTTNISAAYLRPDNFTYVAYGPYAYGLVNGTGTFELNASGASIDVSFHVGRFVLTFAETGLTAGASWGVVLAGRTNSSRSTTVVDDLNNGSYPYLIPSVPGYSVTPQSGTAPISGGDDTIYVTFSTVRYAVNVTETGLPAGAAWSIRLNGVGEQSEVPYIDFAEPNGTYNYTVAGFGGYATAEYNGSVEVTGGPVTLTVPWVAVTYSVRFQETGLPSGVAWGITVRTTTVTAHGPTVSMNLTNGTFLFTVVGGVGFVATPLNGSVVIHANSTNVSVAFVAAPAASSFWGNEVVPGLPTWELTAIGIAGVAVVGLAGILLSRKARGRRTPPPS